MLALKHLSSYPVPPVIDPTIEAVLECTLAQRSSNYEQQAIVIFRTFLDIHGLHLSAIGLEKSLSTLQNQFCGFLHNSDIANLTNGRIYSLATGFQKQIGLLCDAVAIAVPPRIRLSKTETTIEVENAVVEYRKLQPNQERLSYYGGWVAHCNGGEEQFWNLSAFHEQYGAALTERFWDTLKDHSNKTIKTTAKNESAQLTALITTFIQLYPTEADFKFAGIQNHINDSVRSIFASQLIDTKQREKCVRSFYKSWQTRIRLIEKILIASGIWSEAHLPLWCPNFKSSSTNAGTHRHIDEQGNAFNSKLVTHVPLSYDDDQAMVAILESIESDIEHVAATCRQLVDATMANFKRRKQLAILGAVKQPDQGKGGLKMTNEANQCATWEHYGYDSPKKNYVSFLGVCGAAATFANNFGLLTTYTLYPFLYLLVEQHPKITESWLTSFVLYDKNGKASGYRQSGSIWIAESYKLRKGKSDAQVRIELNKASKELFDNIIALTARARQHLKDNNDDSWRFLLLGSNSGLSAPYRIKTLRTFSSSTLRDSPHGKAIVQPSKNTDAERAEKILNNLSLTTFRASCGVRTYLRTRSVKAMSEALGHKEYNPKLLSHYLPEPILRYFQARWVRIFQNALVYEAMKDSEYLLEALDFGEEELQAFLQNHKLKPLPEHVMTGHVSDLIEANETVENSPLDSAIIPVTTPVLQVMNCLVDLVEKASKSQKFTKTAAEWYETSKFVLETIDTQNSCPSIAKAMSDALATPLPAEKLKGAIYHVA